MMIPVFLFTGFLDSGKTTFIRLLLALIKPDSGELEYVDENGNREVACVDSRRLISYVPQGNTLMTGTVRSNLLLGNKSATEEQMWEALRCADADKFLQKTPKGLDTVIAESSGGISEGQAQRVSIARALLRNKPILIMDEATSALDESSEKRIIERLSQKREKTCFIITHRNSVLKYCDYVLQIDEDAKATLKKSNN
ncbi:MAG: ATP-binding cassette domain-containing protein [Eubacteriales bacterium]|nr:ATP-binding cassette domain-containing protein [Eubacteriales bacterium]